MQEILDKIRQEFGFNPLKLTRKGWFLLEATPLPPRDEIYNVITDIHLSKPVNVFNGKIYHSINCTLEKHDLNKKLNRIISGVIDSLEEQRFLVAVNLTTDTEEEIPVAICLEPQIDYITFPDHPHISLWWTPDPKNFITHSLCYAAPGSLNSDPYEKVKEALGQICIWLFRHQVWLETRKVSKGLWIGPGAGPLKPQEYPEFLNPLGFCRCGSKKIYAQCHLASDIALKERCTYSEAKKKINSLINTWPLRIGQRQDQQLNALKGLLLADR